MYCIRRSNLLRCHITKYINTVKYLRQFSSIIAQEQPDPWILRKRVVSTSRDRWSAKPLGIDFEVSYLDSGGDWHFTKKKSSPVVLAVHGMPADHKDILPVVAPLHDDLGCRVITLNFPGFLLTKTRLKEDEAYFKYSTVEQTEFMVNFLASLRINRVDLLVAHSAGVLPSVILCGMGDFVKSLLFISSFPGHRPPRTADFRRVLRVLIRLFHMPIVRPILEPFIRTMNKVSVNFRGDPEHFVNVFMYVANANFDMLVSVAQELEIKQVPMVYAFSRDDKVMDFDLNNTWAGYLGLDECQMDEYDAEFKLKKCAEGDLVPYRKGVIFEKAGHYPQFRKDTALPILIQEAKTLIKNTYHRDGDQ